MSAAPGHRLGPGGGHQAEGPAGAVLRPARHWRRLTTALILGSVLALALPAMALDWQPAAWLAQPWRLFTAAWVHWSHTHLVANVLAALVLGAFGSAAHVPASLAVAWLAAWPLTHLGLLIKPELLHYGGLSGVLHAGVAIVCLHLLVHGRGLRRAVGAGVGIGLVAKLWSEEPWAAALQTSQGWDIALAPLAHTTGALAGLACAALALAWLRRRQRAAAATDGAAA